MRFTRSLIRVSRFQLLACAVSAACSGSVSPVAPAAEPSVAAVRPADLARCLSTQHDPACFTAQSFNRAVAAALAPSPPGNLAASVGGSTVSLTWNAPTAGDPVASYVVEAGSGPGATDLANFDTGSAAATYVAVGVPNGTYYVRVRGRATSGVGAASNEVVVVVSTNPCPSLPPTPSALTSSVAGTTVTLQWGALGGGCVATSYIVEAGSAPGGIDLGRFSTGSAATVYVASAVPQGTYYVRVRAQNGAGTSGPSNEVIVTVGGASRTTIGFGNPVVKGAPYTESGFTVTSAFAGWTVNSSYGRPAPFIQFVAAAGTTSTAAIQITFHDAAFSFASVDLYSSTTPIPYTFVGLRNSTSVFTVSGTQPNTFGAFATILNPRSADLIDTLSIALTNASAACCSNPMGLDNIVVVY